MGKLRGDRVIWLIILLFAMISLAVVYSATSALAYRYDSTPFSYMMNQALFYIVGFGILLVCYRIPLKWYRWISYIGIGAAAIMLMLPVSSTNCAASSSSASTYTLQR